VLLVVFNNFDELQGRVFKSQIQKIWEELGEDIIGVVKENELAITLKKLKVTSDFVILDNKSIVNVVNLLTESVRLSTYPIVMTRQQGNLSEFITGIKN